MLSFLVCLIGVFAPVSVTHSDVIQIQDRQVRLADVVDLNVLDYDIRDNLADKVIATIPINKSYVMVSRGQLIDLVRRRIPGLPLDLNEGDITQAVRIEYVNTESLDNEQVCYRFKNALIKGEAIIADDLRSASCEKKEPLAKVKYNNATGVLRAATDIAVDSYAGRISVPSGRFADKNDELLLSVSIGPVRIEKTVWALQPANGAKRIFVKDRDGNVLRVPIQKPLSAGDNK